MIILSFDVYNPFSDRKMKLEKIAAEIEAQILAKSNDEEITKGYTSDMLSDVIANAGEGTAWITIQIHMNVIAVAQLKKIPVIVLTGKAVPAPEALSAAKEKGISVLRTELDSFNVSGKLFRLFHQS